MKNRYLMLAGVVLGIMTFLIQNDGNACTTFQLIHSGKIFVGKNYDWMVPDGLVMVNKRGIAKTAYQSTVDNTGLGEPATWVSKYGSISFVQYGRELPAGGMNEAGLVVESMGLFRNIKNKKFPEPDERVSILMQQWKQYQLDNSATVADVIASDKFLRIRPKKGTHNHFLVSDRQGDCAVIEFIDGKMVVYTRNSLPHKVLTNSTYAQSLGFLNQGKIPEPDQFKSIERFIRAANMVKKYGSEGSTSPLDYSFDILKSVSWSADRVVNNIKFTSNTRWSIVYDSTHLRVYFRTWDYQQIRSIDMARLDFSCKTLSRVLDINENLSGDVTDKFVEYTQKINRDLIGKAFTKTPFLTNFPANKLDILSKYPDTFVCGKP
jgi:choloylglycine hydrolase